MPLERPDSKRIKQEAPRLQKNARDLFDTGLGQRGDVHEGRMSRFSKSESAGSGARQNLGEPGQRHVPLVCDRVCVPGLRREESPESKIILPEATLRTTAREIKTRPQSPKYSRGRPRCLECEPCSVIPLYRQLGPRGRHLRRAAPPQPPPKRLKPKRPPPASVLAPDGGLSGRRQLAAAAARGWVAWGQGLLRLGVTR